MHVFTIYASVSCIVSHFGDYLMFYVLNSHLLAAQLCWNEGSVLTRCFVFPTWQANLMYLGKINILLTIFLLFT